MGGIVFKGTLLVGLHPDHLFSRCFLYGCINPTFSGAQKWAELLCNPYVLGCHRERDVKAQRSKKNGKAKLFLCLYPFVGCCRSLAPRIDLATFQ